MRWSGTRKRRKSKSIPCGDCRGGCFTYTYIYFSRSSRLFWGVFPPTMNGTVSTTSEDVSSPYQRTFDPAMCRMAYFVFSTSSSANDSSDLDGTALCRKMNLNEPTSDLP